jgi:hypothetical protein
MHDVISDRAKSMAILDTKAQIPPQRVVESHNFLGLADGEVEQISQDAVRQALEQKQAYGFPVTHWNGGKPPVSRWVNRSDSSLIRNQIIIAPGSLYLKQGVHSQSPSRIQTQLEKRLRHHLRQLQKVSAKAKGFFLYPEIAYAA